MSASISMSIFVLLAVYPLVRGVRVELGIELTRRFVYFSLLTKSLKTVGSGILCLCCDNTKSSVTQPIEGSI